MTYCLLIHREDKPFVSSASLSPDKSANCPDDTSWGEIFEYTGGLEFEM